MAAVTSIIGVNGETGAAVGTVDVSNTKHTNAGTYSTDSWSFTGTANYNNIAATIITDHIGKADASVVVAAYDVTYDGHDHTATVTSITGVNGEVDATVGTVDVSHTTHKNAGTYNADYWTFTGTANYNNIAATTITDTIDQVTLTAGIIGNPVKPYDGNTSATLTSANFSLTDLVGMESFTVTQTSGTYNSKDVATAVTVMANLAAGDFTPEAGTLASNYVLPNTASGPGHITPVMLTASIVGNPTRPYNGNRTATLTSANFSLSGLIGIENFTVMQTSGTYNSKDVATANTVTANLVPGDFTATNGAVATNYVLPTSASGDGHVTVANVTASIVGGPTRPYNGGTNATLTSANFSLSGVASGESFTVTQTAGTYNSKDVLGANTVTASLSAGQFTAAAGTDANNYALPMTASGPGHITPTTVTGSIIGNPTRPYNGNTSVTLMSANFSLSGLVGMESLTVTQTTGSYNSKDVLAANTVTASLSAGDFTPGAGTLASNYTLPTSVSGPGQITTVTLTASIILNPTKTYDGNTNATLSATNFSLGTLVSGESITVTKTTGTYNSKDVPIANTVSTNLATTDFSAAAGTLLSNYVLPTTASGSGHINPAQTSTGVMSSKNPSTLNESVTFTATIANTQTSPIPTGTVTFTYTNSALNLSGTVGTGTASLDSSGKAIVSSAALPVNASVVKATYNNVDGNFIGGTTGQVTQNVSYIFVGFLQPIDNLPITNSSKAGQTIPVKWQLKDVAGNLISDLGTLAPNGLTSGAVTCGSAPVDVIEELAAPGSTVFRFDGTQFIYNWQTSKPWVGGCRTLQVRLSDGTSHYAQFTFK